ncbi:MAG: hypothetical protein FJZ15_07755, partial [Candidatus Omnitrophica bacterium]|nr:hypothetical protein [Candidatus Omnitrophota bacterium]
MSKKLILLILFMSFYSIFCFAQENITITTYYPSPYGSYRELRVQRLALGDNYSITNQYCWGVGCGTNVIADNHDLIVEGSVSIGPALTAAGITQFTGVGLQIYENTNNSSLVRMMGNRSAASGYANLLEFFAPSSPANANRKNFSIVNKNPSVLPGVNSLQVIANNDSGSFNSDILSIAHDANIWVNGNVGIGVTPPTVRLHLVGPPT